MKFAHSNPPQISYLRSTVVEWCVNDDAGGQTKWRSRNRRIGEVAKERFHTDQLKDSEVAVGQTDRQIDR